jgi:hypothetical protein
MGPPDRDWKWPIYEYPIPRDWESGAYIALFVPLERGDALDAADPRYSEAATLFVVKSRDAKAKILYKLPLFTYHAYNEIGDPCGSLYTGGYSKVTLHRPGGGVGGRPWDYYFPDYYDTSSLRQTFWHWDAPCIGWLEHSGFEADYCTDLDVHENLGNCLAAYRLLLSVGHDEYWSAAMRRNVAKFVENGGNVAFLSGNTCWWRVHLVECNTAFVCDKSKHSGDDQRYDLWFRFDPENRLTGVSHRNGGGQWWGKREAIGYTVQHADHWVFKGTGLRDGDTFGADHALVGYECDGASISDRPDEHGFAFPRHNDGTPETFIILGIGRLGPEWAQDPEHFPGGRTATMGIYVNNGVVFTAATTDWPRVLASGAPLIEKITENLLHHLGSGGPRHPAAKAKDSAPIAEHPAARAWRKLTNCQLVPESIIQQWPLIYHVTDKPSVYRLTGIGPGGANVIAKRCESAAASTECSIYNNVLAYLPVSMIRFYGLVAEDNQQFCWLFLEDAGEEPYLLDVEEHRVLAGHWLGMMNISAQQLHAATRLPDRGPDFYLKRLRASRETIREIVENSSFSDSGVALLRALISHCDALERQWDGIERFCKRMPQTLVHGDFAIQNARLRGGPDGNSLVVIDWEGAGWGSPAADLAQFRGLGTSLSPDLRTYYSVVRSRWSAVRPADLESLAEIGRMFRLISSLDWANSGYRAALADSYVEELGWYEQELVDWLRAAEVQGK